MSDQIALYLILITVVLAAIVGFLLGKHPSYGLDNLKAILKAIIDFLTKNRL